eukprot:scaffold46677_cov16-Prasinocladus_malaysianus.AAC.1
MYIYKRWDDRSMLVPSTSRSSGYGRQQQQAVVLPVLDQAGWDLLLGAAMASRCALDEAWSDSRYAVLLGRRADRPGHAYAYLRHAEPF